MVQMVVAHNANPTNPASELGKEFGLFEKEKGMSGQNQSAHRRTTGSVPFCGASGNIFSPLTPEEANLMLNKAKVYPSLYPVLLGLQCGGY